MPRMSGSEPKSMPQMTLKVKSSLTILICVDVVFGVGQSGETRLVGITGADDDVEEADEPALLVVGVEFVDGQVLGAVCVAHLALEGNARA